MPIAKWVMRDAYTRAFETAAVKLWKVKTSTSLLRFANLVFSISGAVGKNKWNLKT